MRKAAAGGLALLTFAATVFACSSFTGDEPPGTTPTDEGGVDGGEAGVPSDGFLLTPFPAEPPFVIQGKRIKVPVKIQRGERFKEPVAITLTKPPSGIVQLGNAVITGETTDVELEVDASFKQGVVELLFEARSDRAVTQSGRPKIFVRGASGSLDTTFAATGILETGFDATMHNVVDSVVLLTAGSSS